MSMGHKCFISFKKEDEKYKQEIQSWKDEGKVDMIDKSLDTPINSTDEDYVMRKIREDYLSDSSVTIFIIGSHSSENLGLYEQLYIKRELQASLYNGEGNSRNGILGVVLPEMYSAIYSTVIKEFSRNYYLNSHGKCAYSEDDRYCVLVKWDDFIKDPNNYINMAYDKRGKDIANDVIVYPK